MRSFISAEPQSLVKHLLTTKSPRAQKLDVMFHYIPGVKEFTAFFAGYVLNVPAREGGTIFDAAIDQAIAEVERLGLAPITVDAHVEGFEVFARELVSASSKLLDLSVSSAAGDVWNPLAGPLSKFAPPHAVFKVAHAQDEPSDDHISLMRSVMLSHCVDFPRFRALSQNWDQVVG